MEEKRVPTDFKAIAPGLTPREIGVLEFMLAEPKVFLTTPDELFAFALRMVILWDKKVNRGRCKMSLVNNTYGPGREEVEDIHPKTVRALTREILDD